VASKVPETFTEEETERRRDEVIRRMANTPPQPKATSLPHPKKKKKTASVRAAGKSRANRED
jgi:hypothetical protein